jgi:hypothetical protein
MHVASTTTSNDDDAETGRWAPCSPLDDIANYNGTLPLPWIFPRGGIGGDGGWGGDNRRPRYLSTSGGAHKGTKVFLTAQWYC